MTGSPPHNADPIVEPRADAPIDAAVATVEPPPELVDVWARTEPRYRVRAAILYVLNLLLFAGVCSFTYWLSRLRMFDFSLESYLGPARFWVPSYNLTDFILSPINVVQFPEHGVVLGLLIASIVAVPILISILYRFPYALPFVGSVLLFAHLPWMCATLLGSCVLASVRPFRMQFRFGSALLGLMPVVAYLYLANGGNELLEEASPTERLLLMAPWILAILAAALMIATVLVISWLVNYRPGGVAPVVAVMFATPVVLFHARVGVDELKYRALEARCGPQSSQFQPVQDLDPELRELVGKFASDPEYLSRYWSDLLGALGGEPGPINSAVWEHLLVEFLAERHDAFEDAKAFIADHPRSRYVPNALFIQARTLDTRLAMHPSEPPRRRELYSDFPHVQSESVWLALLNGHPHSPLSIAAGYRLAQLHLRRGEVDAALAKLDAAQRIAASLAGNPASQPAKGEWLKRLPPETSLNFQAGPYLVDARRLASQIRDNRDDPKYGNQPLAELASLDPRRSEYRRELTVLTEAYRDAKLYDNLLVRRALVDPDIERRAEELARLIPTLTSGDALPEAQYHLADIELQRGGETGRERGIARLREIVSRFGDSVWAIEAADRLEHAEPRGDARAAK